MTDAEHVSAPLRISLPDAAATAALGCWLAGRLGAGDTVLLEGPIGAGKSHLARALIHARLAGAGQAEEVPSPTFTLVQQYEADGIPIVHADLYRLGGADMAELGLDEAFGTALTLVEWPDRLGSEVPRDALTVRLDHAAADGRTAVLTATTVRHAAILGDLARDGLPEGQPGHG